MSNVKAQSRRGGIKGSPKSKCQKIFGIQSFVIDLTFGFGNLEFTTFNPPK
jgi:hypothetical protein